MSELSTVPGTELEVLGGSGVALSEHARLSHTGLVVKEGATEAELLLIAEGLGVVGDAQCFAVGDTANFYRDHFPAQYREWIDRPSPIKSLDSKTVKVYAAVASFYPHEQRARHLASYAGHPGVSFSHFSRLRRYGAEIAEYWLGSSAEHGWSVADMEGQIDAGAIGADDVPVLEPTRTPKYGHGQSFWLGPDTDPQRHLVVCGDSRLPENHAAIQYMGAPGTMIWTDPPYGVDYVSIGRQTKANQRWVAAQLASIQQANATLALTKEETERAANVMTISNDGAADLEGLLGIAFANVQRICIPAAPFYVAGPSGFNMIQFLEAFAECGWDYKEMLVWVKNVMVFGRSDYHFQHEPVFYGYTDGDLPKGRIQELQGRSEGGDAWGTRWHGSNGETTIFNVAKPHSSDLHPTMKPIKLITPMIENSSRPGDIVVDPFLGSGSTLIAADLTGRRCFGIEYDPQYADVIEARYYEHLERVRGGLVIEADAVEVTGPPTTMTEE